MDKCMSSGTRKWNCTSGGGSQANISLQKWRPRFLSNMLLQQQASNIRQKHYAVGSCCSCSYCSMGRGGAVGAGI